MKYMNFCGAPPSEIATEIWYAEHKGKRHSQINDRVHIERDAYVWYVWVDKAKCRFLKIVPVDELSIEEIVQALTIQRWARKGNENE